jgi:hypothetical protein
MPLGTLPRLRPFQIEFHAPIRTIDVDPSDANACRVVYTRVRNEVESGIGRLLPSQAGTRRPSTGRSVPGNSSTLMSAFGKLLDDVLLW